MKLEKYRHIQILNALIEADRELTADSLAKISKSSLRTVKNDIVFLNGLCEAEGGCRIVSYKAKGYGIKVRDQEAYEKLCDDITVLMTIYSGRSVEAINRRMYILQRLLIDENVKIEDLCDELYLSPSSIRKDLEWARRFLRSYHIDLLSSSGKGYSISGKEQDLRSALVELRCSQYHEFQPLYPYEDFDDLFCKDSVNYYTPLRNAFLNILRNSRIIISDIETKKMTSHLCLMYQRGLEGKYPDLDEEIIDELRQTYDYEVAKEIFADETISAYTDAKEIEILNFARLLLINRDLNLRLGGSEDLPKKLLNENRAIFNEIVSEMDGSLGSKMHHMDLFKIYYRDLESLQMELYLKHHFDHTGKMRFITYQEGAEDMISPVPLELTRAMIARLEEKFSEPISDAVIHAYEAVYERLFKRIAYPYRKLRLAVCTAQGLVYSQHISESLMELYGNYIKGVGVYNLYEMRKINFDNYDALVYSGPMLYYVYPLPFVRYQELDYERVSGELFDKLFKSGFDDRELQRIKAIMNIYVQETIRDVDSFIEALSFRYGIDHDAQKAIFEQYRRSEKIINHYYYRTGIMIVFFPYEYTGRSIADIYMPSQNVYYEENLEIRGLICVSIPPDIDLADLKIADHILRYCVQVEGTLDRLYEDKDKVLDMIFDTIIRRKFLNQ